MFPITLAAPMNWIYGALVAMVLFIGLVEAKGWFQLEYSKFRPTQGGMSSRLGMFILYFVPIPAHLYFAQGYLADGTTAQWILSGAVIAHFTKRCLETLFLHKYSGPIGTLTVVQITVIYSLSSMLGGYLFAQSPDIDALFALGGLLFVVGQAGNFYHHKILADLRDGNTGYALPQGGLFGQVTCPHYLMEVVSWIGLGLMSHQWAMLLLAFGMHNYLAARAWKTRDWYRDKFPEYPSNRKCILPGVF